MRRRAAGLGGVVAVLAIAGLHGPFDDEALVGLALFLALTAGVYPGALLAQRANRRTTASEIGFGGAVLASAWLGIAIHPLWTATGYAGHAVWDWLHHLNHVPTRTTPWFPPACAAFDIIVAIYAVWLVTGWP